MASFKVGNVDATQSTSITNISNVPSKVNFEADSIYDIQEKLNLASLSASVFVSSCISSQVK